MSGFRLGVVLRLREMAEDSARGKLAAAIDVHRLAAEALVALLVREQAAQRRLLELAASGATAGDIVAVQHGIEAAELATAAGRTTLDAAGQGLMEARAVLADASRRREVVERLRDRLKAAEVHEAQRREDNVLSEIAGVRHARSLGAEAES
jgi:flagellar export protein FliJ